MYNPKQTGFFPLIQLKVEEGLSQQEKDYYLGLPSLEEKLKWIYKLPRLSSDHQDNVLKGLTKLDYGLKSSEKSKKNREAGNAQFYAGNIKQAQFLYSVAVFTAPTNSEDLALAYANRSARDEILLQIHALCSQLSWIASVRIFNVPGVIYDL